MVGDALPAGSGDEHAFLYNNGTMTDLNSLIPSGWILEVANAINDNGQIVGQGINSQGQSDAFLLTPVPEPGTLALLAIGAVSLLAYAWRRRRQAAWDRVEIAFFGPVRTKSSRRYGGRHA